MIIGLIFHAAILLMGDPARSETRNDDMPPGVVSLVRLSRSHDGTQCYEYRLEAPAWTERGLVGAFVEMSDAELRSPLGEGLRAMELRVAEDSSVGAARAGWIGTVMGMGSLGVSLAGWYGECLQPGLSLDDLRVTATALPGIRELLCYARARSAPRSGGRQGPTRTPFPCLVESYHADANRGVVVWPEVVPDLLSSRDLLLRMKRLSGDLFQRGWITGRINTEITRCLDRALGAPTHRLEQFEPLMSMLKGAGPGDISPGAYWVMTSHVQELQSRRFPPVHFVDERACPFECCHYGRWVSTASRFLVTQPRGLQRCGTIGANEEVTALTGVVYVDTEPVYVDGDAAVIMTYLGEGYYRVWYRGRLMDLPWQNMPGWPTAMPKRTQEWWAKIKTSQGIIGWVRAEKDFRGQDGCG